MAAGFVGPDSGRVWARPSSGMGGGGKGRGEGGSGARDRGGVASYGRRGERWHSSARASSIAPLNSRKRMKRRDGKGREASRACARIRAAHGGRGSPGCSTRGVAGSTVASMGAGVGETEQTRNFRFPNPEPPSFGAKQIQFWSVQN